MTDTSAAEKKNFDKNKYIKTVRAKEQQLSFKRNFEIEGDDISKAIQLNSKYRDRAQERKYGQVDDNDDSEGEYGYLENEEDVNDNNEVNLAKKYGLDFADEKDKYQLNDNVVRLKGLDYSLLRKELDKKEDQQKVGKLVVAKTIANIKESLQKASNKKEPSDYAKRIMGVFDKKYLYGGERIVNTKQVIFPIPYSYFEYEIKSTNIISQLPSIVLKDKNADDQFTVIPTIGPDALESLSKIISIYSQKGKKGLKEERERLERLQKEELEKMDEENEQDIFEDVNDEVFEENVRQSEQILNQEKDEVDEDVFKDVKDYREMVIEEQKKEFIKQRFQNILNPNDNESLKMGTRVNDKRKNPFEDDEADFYDECFPQMAPNMVQMKEMREREKLLSSNVGPTKKKKDTFGRRLAAVERVIKEKQDLQKKI